MSKLSIIRNGGYSYHSDYIFEYECKGYMNSIGTNIKVDSIGNITITLDHGFRRDKDGTYDMNNEEGRYETEKKKLNNDDVEKIKNIINENMKVLSRMGGLEGGRGIKDGRYSIIFLGNDEMNIVATISNLWQFQRDLPSLDFDESNPFLAFNRKKTKYVIAKNLTKLMNVFFQIKNILVESGVYEGYFSY